VSRCHGTVSRLDRDNQGLRHSRHCVVWSGITMSFVLLAIRRWTLPPGSLTLLITANAVLMWLMTIRYSGERWPVLLAAVLGGIVGDFLAALLKPTLTRIGSLRVFAFAMPFSLSLLYFLALVLTAGVWWRIHLWLGASFLAGIVGLGLSLLLAPPSLADKASKGAG
jgi:hypothetical protein